MKRYILIPLLSLWLGAALAQESYFVTIVKGSVSRADGSGIKPGSKLLLTDKVVLGSKESLLILLNPTRGRFVVSPPADAAAKDNKFLLLIKDNLMLHAKNVRLSSRAIDENAMSLEEYFSTNPDINSKQLIIDTLKIKLHGRTYVNADNKENFFFLQLAGPKPVNHKLLVKDNTLLITKEDISFNGALYDKTAGQLKLGYIENYSGEKKAKMITTLEPAFITREDCSNVISGISEALKGKTKSEILKEIFTQVYYLYGKPDEQTIADIYSSIK